MTIEERIERLERTNRRYRLTFILLGVIAVCAVGISAAQDDKVPDVIQAKAFEVVDDEGTKLVEIRQFDPPVSGALIQMNSKSAEGLLRISASGAGVTNLAYIEIRSPQRSHVLHLGAGELFVRGKDVTDITRVVELGHNQGAGTFRIGDGTHDSKLSFNGESGILVARGIAIVDEKYNALVTIGAAKVGEQTLGLIETRTSEDVQLVRLSGTRTESEEIVSGVIVTNNSAGREVVVIGTNTDGGQVRVLNKTGEPVCTLLVDEYGNGEIGAWDRNGKGRTLKPGP